MADHDGSASVHLVTLENPEIIAASFAGNVTQESMQRSIRSIEDAMHDQSVGWLLLRTHDIESMDPAAADELEAWLCRRADEGFVSGVGYCPHSDADAETRSDVFSAMLKIRGAFPGEWCQGTRVGTVLAAITAMAKADS